jgi:hypothetical protein
VAVISRFPFCVGGDEEKCEYVAEELCDLVSGIDETALVRNGLWETFCDDVAIEDHISDEERDERVHVDVVPHAMPVCPGYACGQGPD